jgi:hypothetical protein
MSEQQHHLQYLATPYICSNKHLRGCVGGTLTMFAMSLGLITGSILFWLTLGYTIGYWCGKTQMPIALEDDLQPLRPESPHIAEIATPINVNQPRHTHVKTMADLLSLTQDRLPTLARNLLFDIQTHIQQLDLKLQQHPHLVEEPMLIDRILQDYLPTTINNYLHIPASYTQTALAQGQTAEQLLVEQLSLLEQQLQYTLTHLIQADLETFALNGQFLKQKFTPDSFFKITPPTSTPVNNEES